MKVVVIGKERMQGTSKKSGNQYDATSVHVRHAKARTEGEAVMSIWVDTNLMSYSEIGIGQAYDADFDNRGFLVGFTRLKA